MNYKIKFNNGIGRYPASLFITLGKKIAIFDVWDSIMKYDCRDIIFQGNINDNTKELGFLLSRLITNMYHTSVIITELNNDFLLKELTPNRFIIFFDSNVSNVTYFKARTELFRNLSQNDIIILHPTSLKEFIFTRQHLISKEIKADIIVKLDKFSKEDILENKIYDIDIYNGEFYV